jgi:hypothetical protein
MIDRRPPSPTPERSEVLSKAAFSALVAAAVALIVLKMMLGLAFMAALVVAVIAFVPFFSLLLRMTPKREE